MKTKKIWLNEQCYGILFIFFADCTEAEETQQNWMNGGTCQKLDWGDGAYVFFCHCAKGFSGWHCQFEDDGSFVCFVTHGHARLSNSFKLKNPFCKASAFQSSYFNRIVNSWNFTCKSVPKSSLSSTDVFKTFSKQTLTSLLRTTFDVERPCTWSLVRSCADAIVHIVH